MISVSSLFSMHRLPLLSQGDESVFVVHEEKRRNVQKTKPAIGKRFFFIKKDLPTKIKVKIELQDKFSVYCTGNYFYYRSSRVQISFMNN